MYNYDELERIDDDRIVPDDVIDGPEAIVVELGNEQIIFPISDMIIESRSIMNSDRMAKLLRCLPLMIKLRSSDALNN
jgi:hypothetical protein